MYSGTLHILLNSDENNIELLKFWIQVWISNIRMNINVQNEIQVILKIYIYVDSLCSVSFFVMRYKAAYV